MAGPSSTLGQSQCKIAGRSSTLYVHRQKLQLLTADTLITTDKNSEQVRAHSSAHEHVTVEHKTLTNNNVSVSKQYTMRQSYIIRCTQCASLISLGLHII